MPNWCVGDLKVRGSKENIIRFMMGGFTPVGFIFGETGAEAEIKQNDYSFTRNLPEKHWAFHLNGSHRNFVEGNLHAEFWDDGEQHIIILENFQGAWSIDTEALVNASKKFDVDLKIYAFERGMQFNQDIEIHKGVIIKDDEIQFNDYKWECINPSLGG